MNKRAVAILLVILVVLIVGAIIWARGQKNKDMELSEAPVMSVTAFNQTQKANAAQIAARPNDVIIYTLIAENQSDKTISGYVMEANIEDLSKRATLTDASGASFNSATNSLVWTPLDIEPNGSIEKTFTVRVNPLTAGTASDAMKIKFNNELSVNITGARAAQNSGTVAGSRSNDAYKSPTTGTKENLVVLFAGLVTGGFWYARRRSLLKA